MGGHGGAGLLGGIFDGGPALLGGGTVLLGGIIKPPLLGISGNLPDFVVFFISGGGGAFDGPLAFAGGPPLAFTLSFAMALLDDSAFFLDALLALGGDGGGGGLLGGGKGAFGDGPPLALDGLAGALK